jgi:hypothetical protein
MGTEGEAQETVEAVEAVEAVEPVEAVAPAVEAVETTQPEEETAPAEAAVPKAKESSFMDSMGQNFKKIKIMLKGEGKFDGRDRKTWGRLLTFYFFYYIAVVLLFILVILAYYKGTKSENEGIRPKLHGRGLQSPGINYQPCLNNKNHKEYIEDYHKDIDKNVAFNYAAGTGNIYINQMDNFLAAEGRVLSDYGDFGDCNGPSYGFDVNKPCLFFRLNKVIDWNPLGLEAGDFDTAFTQDTESNLFSEESYCAKDRFGGWCSSNQDKIAAMKEAVYSDGATDYSKPIIKCMVHKGANVPMATFPSSGSLNFDTPFEGKDETAGRKYRSIFYGYDARTDESAKYLTPLVAVQFDFSSSDHQNRDTLFHCFSLDRGIEIDSKKHGSGMILLYAKVRGA